MADLKPVRIVLIEHDAGQATLIQRNLARAGITNTIQVFADGHRALDMVLAAGKDRSRAAPPPMLVLLDLAIPDIGGVEILTRIKTTEHSQHIPVVIFADTDDGAEIRKCYDLGCNLFIIKPLDATAFGDAIRELGLFLTIMAIPERM